MALIPCPDCGTEVSDRAVSCIKCGRPIAPPVLYQTPQPVSSKASTPVAGAPRSQSKSIFHQPLGFGGVVLVLFVIAVLINIFSTIKTAVSPTPTFGPQPTATPDPFTSMTVADHLRSAKTAVQVLRSGGKDVATARRHLEAIPSGSAQARERDKLMAETKRIEKRIAADAARAEKREPKPAPGRQGHPIDQLVRAVSDTPYGPFFRSWRMDGPSAVFSLNPSAWHSMSRSEKRQILDHLASLRTWDETNVLNARFYVGASDIGRIRKSMLGEWEFVPGGSWEDQ